MCTTDALLRQIVCAFIVSAYAAVSSDAQPLIVSGTVRDATNEQALAAANIRIDGTSKGTISNAEGRYRLSLPIGSYRLIFSYLGYRPDTLSLVVDRDIQLDVNLFPVPIQMAEVVVTDEDPAMRIMRLVIENKKRWSEALRSYQLEAFTRQTIRLDTAISSIAESYTTGYWQRGDTLREVIRQKRQTVNRPAQFNPPGVGNIVNFYDDEIRLAGFRFIGPTAPEAFDYYDFKLLQTTDVGGRILYRIQLIPKSRLTPLFRGTLMIAGDSYAVAGVEVTPNEAFTFPLVSDFHYEYAQQFMLYEEQFWMPVDIRMKGRATFGLPGVRLPTISIEQVSSIYEYAINIPLPDTIFQKRRLIVAAEAEKFDSTFWATHEILPLTLEEKIAYERLDSTQTLERQIQPTGPLVALSSIASSSLRFFDVRYNRVEGFFLGGSYEKDSLFASLKTWFGLGYGLSDKRWKGSWGMEYGFGANRRWSVGLEYHHGISNAPDENRYSAFSISLMALFDKIDYRDYYYVQGWRIFGTARPTSALTAMWGYRQERHQSASLTTNFSLFSRSIAFRPNPPVTEGQLRSISLSVRYGASQFFAPDLLPQNYVELDAEHTSPWLSSDFDFTRLVVRSEASVQTYSRRLFFAPTLYLRLTGGMAWGTLPPQRMFALESRASGTGFFGSLRTALPRQFGGDSFVMLTLEHNFRNTPFLALNIPYLYKNSIELLIHGSVAQTWSRQAYEGVPRPTGGWYWEVGAGLGRILGFFRVDITQRLNPPGKTFVTVGVSRIL